MNEGKRFHFYDTSITALDDNDAHARPLYNDLVRLLRRSGFAVGPHPRIKAWKLHTLNATNRLGCKSDLQVEVECSGRQVELKFFQNVVFDNPQGGQYDFDKLRKMPYLIRIRFEWIRRKIAGVLAAAGYVFRPDGPSWVVDPLGAFNHGWDGEYEKKRGIHRFRRGADGWPDEGELRSWTRKDGDGIPIWHGEQRYVLINGRAFRCKVYGGINGMWHCIHGKDERGCHTQQNGGYLRSVFPGRGRHFDERHKLVSIKRDLRRAIQARKFATAERISRYCERAGIAIEVTNVSV
jgi:hypothetical protein